MSLLFTIACVLGASFGLFAAVRAFAARRLGAANVELAREVLSALQGSGLCHWLDYGSALAALRGVDFIAFDDVDLGTTAEVYPLLRARLQQRLGARFLVADRSHALTITFREPGLFRGYASLDVYQYLPVGPKLVRIDRRGAALARYDRLPVDLELVLPPTHVPWLGLPHVPVPAQLSAYLTLRYGCLDADAVYEHGSGTWVPRRHLLHALGRKLELWWRRRMEIASGARELGRRLGQAAKRD